jgi:hypothetical protein
MEKVLILPGEEVAMATDRQGSIFNSSFLIFEIWH